MVSPLFLKKNARPRVCILLLCFYVFLSLPHTALRCSFGVKIYVANATGALPHPFTVSENHCFWKGQQLPAASTCDCGERALSAPEHVWTAYGADRKCHGINSPKEPLANDRKEMGWSVLPFLCPLGRQLRDMLSVIFQRPPRGPDPRLPTVVMCSSMHCSMAFFSCHLPFPSALS